MSQQAERVHEILDQDVFLQVAIARGIENKQAAARWILENHDIETSVDTIVREIEDYRSATTDEFQKQAREAIEHAKFSGNVPVSVLKVKRNEETHREIGNLFESLDPPEEPMRLLPGHDKLLVVVEREHRDAFVERIGAENIAWTDESLVEFRILPSGKTDHGSGVVELAVRLLNRVGIEVPYSATGSGEHVLVIDEDDMGEAFRLLNEVKFGLDDDPEPQ